MSEPDEQGRGDEQPAAAPREPAAGAGPTDAEASGVSLAQPGETGAAADTAAGKLKAFIASEHWLWLERLKDLAQVAALVVAGFWSYYLFREFEEPALKPRATLVGSLDWDAASEGMCQAEYAVEFHNVGRKDIVTGQARVSVWSFAAGDAPPGRQVTMLDPLNSRTTALFEQTTDRLVGLYRPDESDKHGFSFLVKRSPGAFILFFVEVWDKTGKQQVEGEPTWTDYRWDYTCGQGPAEPPAAR